MKKKVIAGPWVGEFGWELMGWQAYLRSLAKNYKLICLGPRSSKYLYSDFCKDYISIEKKDITEDYGAVDMYNCANITLEETKSIVLKTAKEKNIKEIIWLPPHTLVKTKGSHYHYFNEMLNFENNKIKPDYKIFGEKLNSNLIENFDYIFHARARKDVRPDDNWKYENWIKLKDLIVENNPGVKICSIGSVCSSYHIEGTLDMRGKDLEKICKIINNSKAVFGPSSGAMHLASLCNANIVVWSKENNKNRYCDWWNPHRTPTLFLGKHKWHPSPFYVYENFNKWNKRDIISDI